MRWLFLLIAMAALCQEVTRSIWEGVYTEAQAKRGAGIYGAECAGCHGLDLTGVEKASALSGGEFLSGWYGLTAGDLFERIRVTMPASRPGSLSREKTADVLAYILSFNRFPAGDTELVRQVESLKQIRIEAQPAKRSIP